MLYIRVLFFSYPSTSKNVYRRDNCEDSDSSSDAGQWFTFLILFNNFVPISLYVTLELVNYIQASFIDEDIHMYDEEQVSDEDRKGPVYFRSRHKQALQLVKPDFGRSNLIRLEST